MVGGLGGWVAKKKCRRTSSDPGSWKRNWLQGNARISRPTQTGDHQTTKSHGVGLVATLAGVGSVYLLKLRRTGRGKLSALFLASITERAPCLFVVAGRLASVGGNVDHENHLPHGPVRDLTVPSSDGAGHQCPSPRVRNIPCRANSGTAASGR